MASSGTMRAIGRRSPAARARNAVMRKPLAVGAACVAQMASQARPCSSVSVIRWPFQGQGFQFSALTPLCAARQLLSARFAGFWQCWGYNFCFHMSYRGLNCPPAAREDRAREIRPCSVQPAIFQGSLFRQGQGRQSSRQCAKPLPCRTYGNRRTACLARRLNQWSSARV